MNTQIVKFPLVSDNHQTNQREERKEFLSHVLEQVKSWLIALTVVLFALLLMFGSSFAVDNTVIKASVKELVDKDSWLQLTVGSVGGIMGIVALFTQHPKLGFTILGGTAAGLLLLNKIFLA